MVTISQEKKPIIMAIAIIAIVISLISIIRGGRGPKANIDLGRLESLGQFAAQDVVAFLGGPKNAVILDMEFGDNRAMRSQREAFINTLKDNKIKIAGVEMIGPGDRMMGPMMPDMGLYNMSDFVAVVEKHPDVDVIISVVGAPNPDPSGSVMPPQSAPPLIVAQSLGMMMGLKQQIEQGLVAMAIAPRTQTPAGSPEKPATHREWYDRYFQVVTIDNVNDLLY